MSYCIYVGKRCSADGHAWLAGYGDEPSSHWLNLVRRESHSPGSKVEVGVTPGADLSGFRSTIPQSEITFRSIRVNYTSYKGIPAPLTNGGLNEFGVAVRSVWSPSRKELIEQTPKDQTGPNFSDLAGIVLDRAQTARDGIRIIGELIERYGESTYGGNAHVIADSEEGWIIIQAAGGNRVWAAERLDQDAIRVCRPGVIEMVPVDEPKNPNFLYSNNLVSFAKFKGWYTEGDFNFNEIYGDGKSFWIGAQWIARRLWERAEESSKITFKDVVWALRTEKLTGDTAGYGQIVPLREVSDGGLRVLWHAATGPVSAPFSPVFVGQSYVPQEYSKHRYLTAGESSRYMDFDRPVIEESTSLSSVSQQIEGFASAVADCKRLLYLVLQDPEHLLEQVKSAFEQRESSLENRTKQALVMAEILVGAGKLRYAEQLLTYFSNTELLNGVALVQRLNSLFEFRLRDHLASRVATAPNRFDQIW